MLDLQGFRGFRYMKYMGQRLIEIRKNLGVTQKEFAERLGVSLGSVQGYEYGKIPKGEVLKSLLDLGYDVNWLLSGQGHMKRNGVHDVALDRMLMWNVAYFLCKREDSGEDPEVYADAFMEIYDAMNLQQQTAERSDEGECEEDLGDDDNVISFSLLKARAK